MKVRMSNCLVLMGVIGLLGSAAQASDKGMNTAPPVADPCKGDGYGQMPIYCQPRLQNQPQWQQTGPAPALPTAPATPVQPQSPGMGVEIAKNLDASVPGTGCDFLSSLLVPLDKVNTSASGGLDKLFQELDVKNVVMMKRSASTKTIFYGDRRGKKIFFAVSRHNIGLVLDEIAAIGENSRTETVSEGTVFFDTDTAKIAVNDGDVFLMVLDRVGTDSSSMGKEFKVPCPGNEWAFRGFQDSGVVEQSAPVKPVPGSPFNKLLPESNPATQTHTQQPARSSNPMHGIIEAAFKI